VRDRERLIAAAPEPLVPQLKLTAAMLINVIGRGGDVFGHVRALVFDNHEPRASVRPRATRDRDLPHARGCRDRIVEIGGIAAPPHRAASGRPAAELRPQPAAVALRARRDRAAVARRRRDRAAGGVGTGHYALDVVSVIEATLDDPRAILSQQEYKARGEAVAAMKRDGIEYDERMALLEEITYPKPLADLLTQSFEVFASSSPGCATSS
jgi:hypothetical protein